jgi:4-amino-4-deoxy-L-arabinose transferase-like glycosyltransferase
MASSITYFRECLRANLTCDKSLIRSPHVIVLALMLIFTGIGVRIALLVVNGDRPIGSLSGVGDQERYIALANSVFQGRGLSYNGQPTALRPPLYPLLLAGSHIIFGSHYVFVVRLLQVFFGMAVAFVCVLIGRNLFGKNVSMSLCIGAVALTLPTLIFISTELQSEQLATLLTTIFLLFVIGQLQGKANCAIGIGVSSGLATLVRFNCAILVVIGIVICVWPKRKLRAAFLVFALAGFTISPWIVRNALEFNGKILFSSHGSINLLEGVLMPDGRAQHGEDERVRAAVGWLHSDIEVNDPHRNLFPSEIQLDRQARIAAVSNWEKLSWNSTLNLLLKKVLRFWLSTDQLTDTNSFTKSSRRLRTVAVIIYWVVLACAIVGLRYLYLSSRSVALGLGFFILFVTLSHLPFVMNTRLRIPFFDPLLCIMGAAGFIRLFEEHYLQIASPGSRSTSAVG